MSHEDLVSKLRSVLLHHQVSLQSVPEREAPRREESNEPTIAYISSMLLDDDELVQQPSEDDFERLMDELSSLVDSPASSSASSSSSLGSQNPSPDSCSTEEIDTEFLKSLLLECARAVAANRANEVHRLAREIRARVASIPGSPKQRTTLALVDALVARFSGFGAQVHKAMVKGITEVQPIHLRLASLPYFRVPQIFSNVTIFNACRNTDRIHIIDYGIFYGCQWPVFISYLAMRPEGPPRIRMTGIDFPTVDVEQTGRSLVEFAKTQGVTMEFHAVSSSNWEMVQPRCTLDEMLVVNCSLRLRHLREDGSVVDNPRKRFFERIYKLKPDVFLTGVLHTNSNMSSPFFLHRFQGGLDQFYKKGEFFEALLMPQQPDEFNHMLNIMAKSIMNFVACEGLERIERPSSYKSWDARARKAGFEQLPMCAQAVEKVTEAWGAHVYDPNFKMGSDENWLLLGFKDLIIFAMCGWKLKNSG